jgi:hypothetical protein
VNRLPASRRNRACTSFGRPESAGSNRSCTAVETLLTFCPPGPDERTKLSEIARFVDPDGRRDPDHAVVAARRRVQSAPRFLRPAARLAGLANFRPSPIFFASAERVFV